jgi:ATP/maltotriose-dependent transcriptional regulator MalT
LERGRVSDRLASALRFPIAVISAPAGFGKSLAVDAVLATQPRVARCSAGESASLLGFLRALAVAIQPFVDGVHLSLAIAYEKTAASPTATRELALWLREHVAGRDLTLVVDGAEHLSEGDVRRALAAMVEATHGELRWVFTTRETSALPLSAWLARRWTALPVDERVLAFTAEETAAFARTRGSVRSDAQIEKLTAAAGGRASTIALACNPHLARLDLDALLATDTDLERALVEALFRALPDRVQRSLRELSALGVLDPKTLQYLPDVAEDVYTALAEAPELFRQHREAVTFAPAFAELLALEQATAEDADGPTIARLVCALEGAGRIVDALALLERRGARAESLALLERRGLGFIEAGETALLVAATSFLRAPDVAPQTPVVLTLKALAEAQHDRADTAEFYFRLALRNATGIETRADVAFRYALHLARACREDAMDVLEEVLRSAPAAYEPRPAFLATLATAYAIAGRHDEAARNAQRALDRGDEEPSAAARARIFHQAAFCAVEGERYDEAVGLAERAIALARACGAHDVAARATHILYHVALEIDRRPRRALEWLDEFARYAMLSGDRRMRYIALSSALDIHAELGNLEEFERIEDALEAPEFADFSEATITTIVPARALRAAWSGDFAASHAIVAETAEAESRPAWRAQRYAEIALHAAGAGERASALEALRASEEALVSLDDEHAPVGRARAIAALAAAILGERDDAEALLDAVIEIASDAQSLALARAARALLQYGEGGAAVLRDAIEGLWQARLGGFARLIEALPRAIVEATIEQQHPVTMGASDVRA